MIHPFLIGLKYFFIGAFALTLVAIIHFFVMGAYIEAWSLIVPFIVGGFSASIVGVLLHQAKLNEVNMQDDIKRLSSAVRVEKASLRDAFQKMEAEYAIGKISILFDANGRVLYANQAFFDLSGYDAPQLKNMNYTDLLCQLKKGSRADSVSALFDQLNAACAWSGQLCFKSSQNELIDLSINATPCFDPNGNLAVFAITGQVISALNHFNKKLLSYK